MPLGALRLRLLFQADQTPISHSLAVVVCKDGPVGLAVVPVWPPETSMGELVLTPA